MTWASLIGPAAERRLDRRDVEPICLEPNRHQLDSQALQEEQGPVVGGLLDEHPVTRLQQVLEQHRPGLQRPVGDHHLGAGKPPVPIGDPLTEAGVPDPGPVGERPLPVLGEGAGCRLPNRIVREDVGAGRAPGKGDRLAGHRLRP